jgi:phosphate transport system substrate-binding protein
MVIAQQGRCPNSANCPISRSGEVLTIPQGADFHCPVCGHELVKVKAEAIKWPKWPRRAAFVAAAVLLLLLSGFAISRNWTFLRHASAADSIGARHTILRLSGSNTIGESLMPALAEAFLTSRGAKNVHTVAGEKPQETIVLGILPGDSFPSSIRIAAHGSATAFTALADGSCDIGMSSRRIKPEEASKLLSQGNMFAPANEHVLGLDGIAVIVNASNPVSALSKDEVMRIFTGESATWPKGGSSQGAVNIYARDDKSGTYDTFKSLVLAGKPMAPGTRRFEDSNELSDAVARDPNAIGFIALPFVHNAKPVAVSEKGTGALLPTKLTVATEDYSLSRRLYLYTPGTPANNLTGPFVEFALSERGQEVVAANGFVEQNVALVSQGVSDAAPDEYRQLTRNAERLSLDFRFQTGQSEPDNKARIDLDRVVSLIADRRSVGGKILLFGFADSVGTPAANKALSLGRAKIIEGQFIQRGLKPEEVRGFGSDLPVASNDSVEGREKNRRVEIWIRN